VARESIFALISEFQAKIDLKILPNESNQDIETKVYKKK